MQILTKWLIKLLPTNDKLKHYFIGSIIFLTLSTKLIYLYALLINLIIVILWEILQKSKGGTNTFKEMTLDIFFGMLTGLIIYIISIFNFNQISLNFL